MFVASLCLILTMCAITDTVARMHGAGVITPTGAFDILGLSFVAGLAVIVGIGALVRPR
jgi:hypothetical protein